MTTDTPSTADHLAFSRRLPLAPLVVVFLSLMLLVQAVTDVGAINGQGWPNTTYWISATSMVLVVAAAQLFGRLSPRERLTLVVALGLALYMVKILAFPTYFTYYDELSHTRTALDILRLDHLFHPNSLLRISPYFPGLEIFTAALARLSGTSVFISGALIIGAGRLILTAAIYALFAEVSGSQRVAGVASVLYMTNPSFLYFNAGFSYESLALPLAITTLLLTLRWMQSQPGRQSRYILLYLAVIVSAVVGTHHFTSYLLAIALLLLCVCAFFAQRSGGSSRPPWQIALFAVSAALVWLTTVAPELIQYARLIFQPAFESFIGVVAGNEAAHAAFSGAVAPEAASPLWLKLAAFASVIIIVSCIPFGAVLAWRRKANPGVLFLLIVALAYLPIQAFRFAGSAVEATNRSSSTLFLGLAFLIALLVVYISDHLALPTIAFRRFRLAIKLPGRTMPGRNMVPAALLVAIGILFTGGVIIFWPPYGRLPGPYQAGSDIRGISPQGILATQWLGKYLGPGHVVLTDRTTGQLVGVYGRQNIAAGYVGPISIGRAFETPTFGRVTKLILRNKKVEFIIIDKRLSTGLPIRGYYFNADEISERAYTNPIPLQDLTKFANRDGISLIYNNGPIQIYDVRKLRHALSAVG